ncbi:hypothetical protein [Leptothoe sp. PORK10 BA2]|uniref:hypothetical protein n=1 Tax=Leptothoe sp. PORK10 BA2 TaxID=3110254 RepID=UPI002B1F91A1|nr:hypothetical protein [Leptothoe sp. PORK10 BA2]MEA5465115.1 hypothetical protein [Leptothoe sp. PORK10 BA2]
MQTSKLFRRLHQVEDSLYTQDPDRYWDVDAIPGWFEGTGLVADQTLIKLSRELVVTCQLKARWFGEESRYMNHLAQTFADQDLARIRQAYQQDLGASVTWQTSIVLVVAHTPNAHIYDLTEKST